jgi:hypothetical protein
VGAAGKINKLTAHACVKDKENGLRSPRADENKSSTRLLRPKIGFSRTAKFALASSSKSHLPARGRQLGILIPTRLLCQFFSQIKKPYFI